MVKKTDKLLERKKKFPEKKKKAKKVKVKGKKAKKPIYDPYTWCQTPGGENPEVKIEASWVNGEVKILTTKIF